MQILKEILTTKDIVVVPGVYDALSATIAKQAGCEVLYMSGFGVAGSLLGKPDIGLVTATEMIERARQITNVAGTTPVIADGDNGYGGEYNVERLVQTYEQAGIQCIQLEDQVSPKRCGHMADKQVVTLAEAEQKIDAAVRARNSDRFLIMARTDSLATHGLTEALQRGEAFLAAGADILFIEAPDSVAQLEAIKRAFPNTPLVINLVEEGKTPLLSLLQVRELGFQIVLRPISALLTAAKSLQDSYRAIANNNWLDKNQRLNFQGYNEIVGLNRYL